jgi:cytochrome c556
MKTILSFVLVTAAVTLSAPAAAQFAKPEDAIKYRQSAMFVKSVHFGRIGAMVTGRVPFDPKAAVENADVVVVLAGQVLPAYGAGTEGGRAKPEIWKEQAKFKELADVGLADAVKLAAAARTGNLENLKAAFGPAAETCKACHDNFRGR